MPDSIRIVPPSPDVAGSLAEFFAALLASGDDRWFHPHPLSAAGAVEVAAYQGRDVYLVALRDERVVGYGIARGWDDGYAVPSLGIAVHPAARGTGVAGLLMNALHVAAMARGATRVRLRVHPENQVALRLYESLGYQFRDLERGERIATLDLNGELADTLDPSDASPASTPQVSSEPPHPHEEST